MKALCVFVLLLVCAHSCSGAAVMGIDLGSEFLKVAVVKHGSPIQVAMNEQSTRLTPSLVSFNENMERSYGLGAVAGATRSPSTTFSSTHQLLAQTPFSELMQLYFSKMPYSLEADPTRMNYTRIVVNSQLTVTPEELVAMVLTYARTYTSRFLNDSDVNECVITVPAFFSQEQRHALLDAARLAGLTPLSLMHDHAAVALQFGLEKDVARQEKYSALFFDMGARSTKVSLVDFYNTQVEDARSRTNRSVGEFSVRAYAANPRAGGMLLEQRIVNRIVASFEAQHPGNKVADYPRSLAKARKAAKSAKENLSVNQHAWISIESFLGDKDFSMQLSRADFEADCADIIDGAMLPVRQLMEAAGITAENSMEKLNAVVLFGGTSRVPAIQAALIKTTGRPELEKTLNADEAAAFGAAYLAANSSGNFRVRAYNVGDAAPHTIMVAFNHSDEKHVLFAAGTRLPSRKKIAFTSCGNTSILLSYAENSLVPIANRGKDDSLDFAHYDAFCAGAALNENMTFQKFNIIFTLDSSGIVSLQKADVTVQEEIEVRTLVPPPKAPKAPKAPVVVDGTSEEATESAEAEAAVVPDPEPVYNVTRKTVTKSVQVRTHVDRETYGLMTSGRQSELAAQLKRLQSADELRARIAAAKNAVESYIYTARNRLASDPNDHTFDMIPLDKVSTEEDREALSSKLSELEEWLYDEEAATATAERFESRLAEATSIGDPIFSRAYEAKHRDRVVGGLFVAIVNATAALEKWTRGFENETAREASRILGILNTTESWISRQLEAQKDRSLFETPAFTIEQVQKRTQRTLELFAEISRKPKPKPRPPPKPASSSSKPQPTSPVNRTSSASSGESKSNSNNNDDTANNNNNSNNNNNEENVSENTNDNNNNNDSNNGAEEPAASDRAGQDGNNDEIPPIPFDDEL